MKRAKIRAEYDNLVIARDAVLKRKRIIDQIDKFRQDDPESLNLRVKIGKFVLGMNISSEAELMGVLHSARGSSNSYTYSISESSRQNKELGKFVDPGVWREHVLHLSIKPNFQEYSRTVRENYHELNLKIEQIDSSDSGIKSTQLKLTNYTSIYWLAGQIFKFFMRLAPVLRWLIMLFLGVLGIKWSDVPESYATVIGWLHPKVN